MCPIAERDFRESLRDIDSFERATPEGPAALAVKKFARNVGTLLLFLGSVPSDALLVYCCEHCGSDSHVALEQIAQAEEKSQNAKDGLSTICTTAQIEQEPGNFRTLETLKRTQAHLLAIMDRRDVPLSKIHHFLWDRFRGVRQDLFVQGIEARPPHSRNGSGTPRCPCKIRVMRETCSIMPVGIYQIVVWAFQFAGRMPDLKEMGHIVL